MKLADVLPFIPTIEKILDKIIPGTHEKAEAVRRISGAAARQGAVLAAGELAYAKVRKHTRWDHMDEALFFVEVGALLHYAGLEIATSEENAQLRAWYHARNQIDAAAS